MKHRGCEKAGNRGEWLGLKQESSDNRTGHNKNCDIIYFSLPNY